jgi:hypothetical protein
MKTKKFYNIDTRRKTHHVHYGRGFFLPGTFLGAMTLIIMTLSITTLNITI